MEQKRPVVYPCGRGGVQARCAECESAFCEQRTFRAGVVLCGNLRVYKTIYSANTQIKEKHGMKYVYASKTGHVEKIVQKLGLVDALKITDGTGTTTATESASQADACLTSLQANLLSAPTCSLSTKRPMTERCIFCTWRVSARTRTSLTSARARNRRFRQIVHRLCD